MSRAIKARKVPMLAMIQQVFCTRNDHFVPDDMATARIMMSASPRPNVHHWPIALVPLTAVPALIKPLFLVVALSTANVWPTASRARDRAQNAGPIMAENGAQS